MSQPNYGVNRPTADPFKRLIATIIDGLLISVATIPAMFFMVIGAANDAPAAVILGWLLGMVGGFGMLLWEIYLLGARGMTPGKKIMKLICLKQDGQVPGFWLAFGRELLKQVFGNVCFLLNLWLLFDQEKKQLYDKILNVHVYDNN